MLAAVVPVSYSQKKPTYLPQNHAQVSRLRPVLREFFTSCQTVEDSSVLGHLCTVVPRYHTFSRLSSVLGEFSVSFWLRWCRDFSPLVRRIMSISFSIVGGSPPPREVSVGAVVL